MPVYETRIEIQLKEPDDFDNEPTQDIITFKLTQNNDTTFIYEY